MDAPALLACGLGGAVGVGFGGPELVAHGVLPGKYTLDRLDGACSVAMPAETFLPLGPSQSGRFFSRARNRSVGYTIAYPPGHRVGSPLPLVIVLHALGGSHASTLGGLPLAQALAAKVDGRAPAPMALVAADSGGGYWHRHPGDDPMAMVVDELLPRCQRLGLGHGAKNVGALGTSMGGYGALLLAEKHPRLIAAAAAISPAVWTTYAQARAANGGDFSSARDFAANDLITHVGALAGTPVRIASGTDDPFHAGVQALAEKLPASAIVDFSTGCHDGAFFASQRPPSLAFLARHLV